MAGNKTLKKAKDAKNDEFYTQIEDIEREMSHYKEQFRGKVVFCNCDDPEYSNFWKYFQLNFYELGLKQLISTHYEEDKPSYRMDIVSTDKGEQCGIPDYVKTPLNQNGDFRSPECIEILQQADIVITNPPFSLFREYVAQLIEHKKQFIIIGTLNAVHYKEIFPLIQNNQMWLGHGFNGGNAYFMTKHKREYASGVYDEETGIVKFRNVCWLTNMDLEKRHEDIILYRQYSPEEYLTYENYNAINVDKLVDIPCDYYGVMGVPDTFLQSYNPEQFEIIGLGSGYLGQSIGISGIPKEHKALMRGHSAAGDLYYIKDGKPKVPYSRILIKRKR